MFRFEILGTVDLKTADGTAVDAFLKQPKSVGLLAFLALARPRGYVRRDVLVGLLWPDLDQTSARKALNSQLYRVRQQLGPEAVESRGTDEVALGQDVWCDAADFRRLLDEGDKEAALELYRGPLLPGLYVPAADAFERWLDEERLWLTRAAHTAVWEVVEEAREAGDLGRAVRWARQGLAISPHDEGGLRKLLGLYAAAGNRAAALNTYEAFARQLKREYEIEPDAATQSLIRSIARAPAAPAEADADTGRSGPAEKPFEPSPAEFRREAENPVDATTPPGAANPERLPSGESGLQKSAATTDRPTIAMPGIRRKRWAAGAAALVVLLFGIVWFAVQGPEPERPEGESEALPRVAVLYIDVNETDTQLRDNADALTESLISRLSGSEHFDVLSSTAVREFRQGKSTRSIHEALNPTYIVHASMRGENGKVRLTVELIDAATDANRFSEVLERDTASLFELTDELVRETSTMLRMALGKEVKLASWYRTAARPEAAQLLHRAELARTGAQRMEELRNRGAERSLLLTSDSFAVHASRVDPSWPEPDVLRAANAVDLFLNALATGQSSVKTQALVTGIEAATAALARNQDFVPALERRGLLLMFGWATGSLPDETRLAALERAEQDLTRALRLDPRRGIAWATLSNVHLYQNRIEEARYAAEHAYRTDAFMDNWPTVLSTLFNTSFELRDDTGADRWCREIERRQSHDWGPAYCRLLLVAYTASRPLGVEEAWQLARRGIASVEEARRPRIQVMLEPLVAAVIARNQMPDSARRVLESAYDRRMTNVESLRLIAAAWHAMGDHERADRILAEFASHQVASTGHVRGSRLFFGLDSLGSDQPTTRKSVRH